MDNRIPKLLLGIPVILMLLLFSAVHVLADEYPSKPIQIIVPWGPGDTDLATRLMASVLPSYLGQPVVVFNKTGSLGIIGMDAVAKAKPDGYTLIGNGPANFVMPLFHKTPFPSDLFIGLSQTTKSKGVLVTKGDAPWTSLREVLDYATKNPGKIKYGISGGIGTWHHVKMELIKEQSSTNIAFVPFDGNAAVMMATLGGHVSFSLIEKPSALPHIKGGTLKALAIAERDDDIPGVMTFGEQGIRGDFNIFRAIYCRRDLPRDRIKILEEALAKGLKDKSFLFSLQNAGYIPGTLIGEDFRNLILDEEKLMKKIVERFSKTKEK